MGQDLIFFFSNAPVPSGAFSSVSLSPVLRAAFDHLQRQHHFDGVLFRVFGGQQRGVLLLFLSTEVVINAAGSRTGESRIPLTSAELLTLAIPEERA
jgi:hypothetical protein